MLPGRRKVLMLRPAVLKASIEEVCMEKAGRHMPFTAYWQLVFSVLFKTGGAVKKYDVRISAAGIGMFIL